MSSFGPLRILAPPGVYTPRSDTAMLAERMGPVAGARVLELCAGSGALALLAAHRGAARVVAVDRSRRAVLTMRVNARLNGLRLDARHGDLLSAVPAGEAFDVVLANPPYLPATVDRDPRWDAGLDGRAVLDRIIEGADRCLAPGGRLVLIQSDLADADRTCEMLADRGLHVAPRVDHAGAFGPIVEARVEDLVRQGLLEAGDREEVLAVITAHRTEAVAQAS